MRKRGMSAAKAAFAFSSLGTAYAALHFFLGESDFGSLGGILILVLFFLITVFLIDILISERERR